MASFAERRQRGTKQKWKTEAGDGKESFVVAVLGGEDLSTGQGHRGLRYKQERPGYLRKNEERGLACSRPEGGGPESLSGGGRGLLNCVLSQVSGIGDKQPRPDETPLFKLGKPSESQQCGPGDSKS